MDKLLAYGLAIVGLGAIGLTLARSMTSSMSYPAAKLLLTNLLRSNPNQAEMICKQTKGTFYEAIGAAIKIGAMCAGVTDLAVISAATKPGYDGQATMLTTNFKTALGKAKLGGMAVVVAMGLAISKGAMPIWLVVIIGLLGAAAGVALLLRKTELERSLILARAEVLPEVDRAFVEGRYRLPSS